MYRKSYLVFTMVPRSSSTQIHPRKLAPDHAKHPGSAQKIEAAVDHARGNDLSGDLPQLSLSRRGKTPLCFFVCLLSGNQGLG